MGVLIRQRNNEAYLLSYYVEQTEAIVEMLTMWGG